MIAPADVMKGTDMAGTSLAAPSAAATAREVSACATMRDADAVVHNPGASDGTTATPDVGRWQHQDPDGRAVCDVCPRHCRLSPGQRGFCFVRSCHCDGTIHCDTYGRSSGFAIDPVEKKPLNHFLPGSRALSFGTAGCNSACRFCQNWDISKARSWDRLAVEASPVQIAAAAARDGVESVAFTYNDPIVFAEYAIDTADACRARGIRSIAVSAGNMALPAAHGFYPHMDAANIDLKGFDEDFYWHVTGSRLADVLRIIDYACNDTDCWVELTTLLIPGCNDDDAQLHAECAWLREHVGPDVPLHFSAFHPDYRMMDVPPTSPAALRRARGIAMDEGLHYVYTGNVHDRAGDATLCPSCGETLIQRDWYVVESDVLSAPQGDGTCPACGRAIAGVWS